MTLTVHAWGWYYKTASLLRYLEPGKLTENIYVCVSQRPMSVLLSSREETWISSAPESLDIPRGCEAHVASAVQT